MKWLFYTALVVVAGALGAFAIYTFGLRDDRDSERERAQAYAQEVAHRGESAVENLRRIAPGVWRFELPGRNLCIDIHLDEFRPRDDYFDGIAEVACADG